MFHCGIFSLVVCYGLWTFRKWGLSLAKILAIINVAMGLIGVIVAIVTCAGMVINIVQLVVSSGIVVYLYGSAELSGRAQQYLTQLRSHTATPNWSQFE